MEHHHHTEHKAHDHSHHHKMMISDFQKRFWVSLIISIPVLVLSPMIQGFIGYELDFFGRSYFLFGFSSIVFIYGGWPFFKGLKDELKKKLLV